MHYCCCCNKPCFSIPSENSEKKAVNRKVTLIKLHHDLYIGCPNNLIVEGLWQMIMILIMLKRHRKNHQSFARKHSWEPNLMLWMGIHMYFWYKMAFHLVILGEWSHFGISKSQSFHASIMWCFAAHTVTPSLF